MPVRLYDIAKKLGLENKEILTKAKEMGIAAAKVPSSSLDKISAEWLASTMRYHAMSDGGDWDVPLWVAVTHFFNHQTHHRGQITTLLKQFGLDPGVTDFMPLFRYPVNAH